MLNIDLNGSKTERKIRAQRKRINTIRYALLGIVVAILLVMGIKTLTGTKTINDIGYVAPVEYSTYDSTPKAVDTENMTGFYEEEPEASTEEESDGGLPGGNSIFSLLISFWVLKGFLD